MAKLKRCPQCAEQVQAEALVCRFCGTGLPSPSQPTKPKGNGCLYIIGAIFALLVISKIAAPTSNSSKLPTPTDATSMDASPTAKSIGKLENSAHDHLLSLSDKGQASMLGKVVGEGCVGKLAFYQGSAKDRIENPDPRPRLAMPAGHEDDATWNVRCTDGRSFVVGVHPDGTSQVLECSLLETMNAGKCFKHF